ncbi:hypothetical protein D3C77_699210 [compost metagenome]
MTNVPTSSSYTIRIGSPITILSVIPHRKPLLVRRLQNIARIKGISKDVLIAYVVKTRLTKFTPDITIAPATTAQAMMLSLVTANNLFSGRFGHRGFTISTATSEVSAEKAPSIVE